jgi:hypothetical protein
MCVGDVTPDIPTSFTSRLMTTHVLNVVSCARYPTYRNTPFGSGLHPATLKRHEVQLSSATNLTHHQQTNEWAQGWLPISVIDPTSIVSESVFLPPATGLISPSSHFLRLTALVMSDFIGGGIPAAISSSFWSDFPTMDMWEKVQSFP